MTDLLTSALDAHGGLSRRREISLTSTALPLLGEYDCHEPVPVDLDAERDGVRRNKGGKYESSQDPYEIIENYLAGNERKLL